MKEHFLPTNYEKLMYTKFISLKQDTKYVEEYTKEFHELSIQNQVWESDAQITAHYKVELRMDIQLEMIVAHTYNMDNVYQLAPKIEEGLKFQASKRPNSQLGSTLSNWTASKPLITSSLKTYTDANGGVNNQKTSNTMNKGGSKVRLNSNEYWR